MPRRDAHQSTYTLTATILTVVIIGFLYWARTVVIPLALAVFLSFILGPAVTRLRRWRLGRVPAVLTVVGTALLVVGAVGWLVSWQLTALVQELPKHADKIQAKVQTIRGWLEPSPTTPFGKLIDDVEKAISPKGTEKANAEPMPVVIEAKQPGWVHYIEGLISPAAEAAAQGALSFLLVIFLLLGKEDMRNRMIRLIGPSRLTATTRAVDDAGARISRYLRTQLLVNAGFGAAVAVALMIVGVPYALLWGFVAGLMRYIPYIGTIFGLVPPSVIATTLSHGWTQPLQLLAIYIVLEVVLNAFIEPRAFGQSLGLSEVAQVLSAAFWAFLWGPIGLILSGPLSACLLVLGKNVPQLHWLDVLLGHEEALPPEVTFFQRLMARDREEAMTIAAAHAAAGDAAATVDNILIPALGQAQEVMERREVSEDDGRLMLTTLRSIADDLTESIPATEPSTDAETIRVLLVPATGPGDVMAVELLRQRLDSRRWEVQCLAEASLASDLLATVHNEDPAIVVVVALAPGGFSHLRYLCKRLHQGAAESKLLIARWGGGAIATDNAVELRNLGADELATTISETLQKLNAWRSVLATAPVPLTLIAEERAIGTLTAL